ncbi:peptidyl-tRNA hydrolase domain-containing protein 1 [Geranomyces variabilis]|uniref:peptidyl-tRNA hydrolase n=1 Tax=Geranomyces variabilis TaxID=109894 RepID=A0AAD5TJT7_9FUNG|nr:peptidyl-tRNA hydrolase domain-containing protein 1 [Geranomyces variabilis]
MLNPARPVLSATSPTMSSDCAWPPSPTTSSVDEPLTMYIFVRRDLQSTLGWPGGSVISQACHASTAVLHEARDDPDVHEYLGALNSMHKVVFEAKDLAHLDKIARLFRESDMTIHAWEERPEMIRTAIATKPYRRSTVAGVLKKCRVSLFK